MGQDIYKLDLDIELEIKVCDEEVQVTATYDSVKLDQMLQIIEDHRKQGNIIKSFHWR